MSMKRFYRVQKNDTLVSVAGKFALTVTEIIRLNNLTDEIEEGDMLYLESSGTVYTVKPQDTLESICEKFSIDKETFIARNGEVVFFGEQVVIP